MDIKEVRPNLGKKVRYVNNSATVDGEFVFNACIIRRNEKGEYYYQAELQQGVRSIMIVALENVYAIPQEA